MVPVAFNRFLVSKQGGAFRYQAHVDARDEGRKGSSLLAIKMQGTNRIEVGEQKPANVTPDLSYD